MSANTIQTINTTTSRKFTLQPMKYMLTPVNSMLALFHIRDLCNGVGQDESVVPSSVSPSLCKFVLSLNEILLQRNSIGKPTIFGYLPAPVSVNIIKQIIGDDGYYFKRTTSECDVDFIWHDRKNNMFLFWAQNNFRISRAMNAIRWRSNKIMTLAYEAEQAATEDYSDMPDLLNSDGTIYRGENEAEAQAPAAQAPAAAQAHYSTNPVYRNNLQLLLTICRGEREAAPATSANASTAAIEDISEDEEEDCRPPSLERSYSMSYSRGEGCRSRISSGLYPEFEAPGIPE